MLKYILFPAVFIIVTKAGFSQRSFSEEISFVNYLIDNDEYRDAIFVLNTLERNNSSFNDSQKDSLNYLLGWVYYNIKSLDTSSMYLEKVGDSSVFLNKSRYYQAFNNIFMNKRDSANTILNNMPVNRELEQLRLFELAGVALLERNYDQYKKISRNFDYTYYPVTHEQKEFDEYFVSLQQIKNKSPFLAATMSAIIPGSGKWYAGYRGKAIASFLQVSLLGAVAAENYVKAGPVSPQFIIFAGFFSIFYIGNIWGSVLSVQIKRDELFRKVDHNIMLDLHIPLRRVFN
ncbi:MAG: hypothetical protein FVQ77_10745 [Cytophagales bacterium]|nr:hypothetical protein [Cytophagales bacterium]